MNYDYLHLIERIDAKGTYQRNLLLTFFLLWFASSYILIGPYFLFILSPFECPGIDDVKKCKEFVCNLPENEWKNYEQGHNDVKSMIDEFGEYHCQYEEWIGYFKMITFVGIFFGYIFFMYFVDNHGRRIGLILTWFITTLGTILVCCSVNIQMACIGLFLGGAGTEACLRITISILNEVVNSSSRQTYSLVMQASYGVGGMTMVAAYYYIVEWRIVMIFMCGVPTVATMVICYFYVEEIPRYLVKMGADKMHRSLAKIAKRNHRQSISLEEIQQVVKDYNDQTSKNELFISKKHTYIDLIRYPSLRKLTIPLCFNAFCSFTLYYGPSSLIDKFSFSLLIAQLLLSVSDFFSFPTAAYFIRRLPRRKTAVVNYFMVTFFFVMGHFGLQYESTLAKVVIMISLFGAKFCTCFNTGIIFLHMAELYPTTIRGNAFGGVATVGSLGPIFIQYLIQFLQDKGQDPLLYFAIFGALAGIGYMFLPETLNKPLKSEIEEEQANLKQSLLQSESQKL